MTWAALAGGLLLLFAGGELLVHGAVAMARRLEVSPLMIGLTLVGFGTSAPELVTSVDAALLGSPGIAVGNVVGSNIANILLILGLAALLAPIAVDRRAFRRDAMLLALATAAGVLACLIGELGRPAGGALLVLLAGYLVYSYRAERASPASGGAELDAVSPERSVAVSLAMALAGLLGTVAGAHLLVTSAITLATRLGISEAVVGLTVVAVGTSLPELAVSVSAALRRQADIAFGNIIGSNIFNLCGILGVTALVRPIAVPPQIARLDVWVMAGVTLVLILLVRRDHRLSRPEGGLLLAAYAGYVALLMR